MESIREIQKQIDELEIKKKGILKEYMKKNKLFIPEELDNILKVVCSFFEVTIEDLKSKRRIPEFVIARRFYCYLAREKTKASLHQIGKKINRDHSTVLYSCNVVSDELRLYTDVKYKLTELNIILNNEQR